VFTRQFGYQARRIERARGLKDHAGTFAMRPDRLVSQVMNV